MTIYRMALKALIEKGANEDFLKEMIGLLPTEGRRHPG